MLGPARKREAVVHVRQSLDVSERRACRATRQPRSTQRYHLKRLDKDKALVEKILRLSAKEKRAGCRAVWRHLRRNSLEVNHKRVHRIWKREGLRLPLKSHKRRRLGSTEQGTQRFKTLYIEPGAPWQNSYTESFNARFRDEFLNVELFSSKLEAKVLSAEHREKYSNHRPHSSLEGMTPGEFAARCLAPLRGLRPKLRKTAKRTRNTNKSSHNNWIKFRGHSQRRRDSRFGVDLGSVSKIQTIPIQSLRLW